MPWTRIALIVAGVTIQARANPADDLRSDDLGVATEAFSELMQGDDEAGWRELHRLAADDPVAFATLMNRFKEKMIANWKARRGTSTRMAMTGPSYHNSRYVEFSRKRVLSSREHAEATARLWKIGFEMPPEKMVIQLGKPRVQYLRRIAIAYLAAENDGETFGYDWKRDPRSRGNADAIRRWHDWAAEHEHEVVRDDAVRPTRTLDVTTEIREFPNGVGEVRRTANITLDETELTISEGSRGRVSASDGFATLTTEYNRDGNRQATVVLSGSESIVAYYDLDGDGMLDAMRNQTNEELFIQVDNRWRPVFNQIVGFSIGNSRTTADTRESFTFEGSRWVPDSERRRSRKK